MLENPYQPPTIVEHEPQSATEDLPLRRPVGVAILSVLLVLLGLLLCSWVALLAINRVLGSTEEPPPGMATKARILAIWGVATIAAGAGLCLARRWGWWLAAFIVAYCMESCALQVVVLVYYRAPFRSDTLALAALVLPIVLAIIFLGSALYLFRANALAFCGLRGLRKGRALLIVAGVAALTVCGLQLLGYFLREF